MMASDSQEKTITGGCLCRAVRYEIKGDALMSGTCHCRDCQRESGAGCMPVTGYMPQQVTITGNTTEYSSPGDSGGIATRCFCPTCGSSLFGKPQSMPGMILVTAGTMDDPENFTSQMSIYTKSCPSWQTYDKNIPAFDAMPPKP